MHPVPYIPLSVDHRMNKNTVYAFQSEGIPVCENSYAVCMDFSGLLEIHHMCSWGKYLSACKMKVFARL